MQSVTLFAVLLLSIIIMYNLAMYYTKSYADNINFYSPSFVRQEVKVENHHFWHVIPSLSDMSSGSGKFTLMEDTALDNITGVAVGQIESVYHLSDGKMLNVTFMLTDPFDEAPVRHVPSYNILVDADSDPSTGGDHGIDYRIRVLWDNTTKSWHKIVEDVSAFENTRILDENKNYTNFFNKNDSTPTRGVNSYYPTPCCYVTIPVDLRLFNYPKQYSLVFTIIDSSYNVDKNNKESVLNVVHSTSQVAIPPPRLSMSAEQKLLEIRAGDEKTLQFNLNSTSFLPMHVFLSVNKGKEMIFKLTPEELYIDPHGFSNSVLRITSFPDTPRGPDTVTINAQAFFPTVNEKNQYSFESERSGLSTDANVAIAITDPPTFDEKFSAFWDVYGNALNLLAGGFLGGFSGFLFARIERKKEKRTSS